MLANKIHRKLSCSFANQFYYSYIQIHENEARISFYFSSAMAAAVDLDAQSS
jgi:hypothetical protein